MSTPLYNIGTEATRINSGTVTFRDGPEQWSSGMKTSTDATRHVTVHGDVSLDAFFARPIPIYSTTWTPSATFSSVGFQPWSLYMQNPRVSNRMSNYRLFSGTLNLKFMINGNSFYYGRIIVSYTPYWLRDYAYGGSTGGAAIMQHSQRLKLYLDPCESQGGELELPFLWHNDMLDLITTEYDELGAIDLKEINMLKHANGATTPINITVYAWMTNVKLSVPTIQDIATITPQAGDEYGTTPFSSVASSVAAAAGKLSSVPMIGPYMKATSMAAGAMGSVASMFGFSRPVNLAIAAPMKARPLGELACTDVADGSVKLTVDSKQELTIDPAVVGLSGEDELALKSIVSRESYCYTFPWATTATPNTLLFNARVNPTFAILTTATLGTSYTVPANTFGSIPFKYWRGTMRYRFMIVASAYHKGRLKFVWEPSGPTGVNESNVQYTKIVDIGVERDFVVDVSWGQPTGWLEVRPVNLVTASNTMRAVQLSTSGTNQYDNGTLVVFVLNELTTPNSAVANSDVAINVFTSMCDDAEFAAPNEQFIKFSPVDGSIQPQSGSERIVPQSGDVETEQPDTNAPEMPMGTEEYVPCAPDSSSEDLVYMGERISSLRQLMKRYMIDYHFAQTGPGIFVLPQSDFPMKYGYTPYGLRGTLFNTYNICNTTMLRYCAMGYLFYRGGIRRKYVMHTSSTNPQFALATINRRGEERAFAVPNTVLPVITDANTLSLSMLNAYPSGAQGMTAATVRQNQAIEAELPFYRKVRFALCRRKNSAIATDPTPYVEDLGHAYTCQIQATNTAAVHTSFVSAAEDSSFFCFQGCVPFYYSPTLV